MGSPPVLLGLAGDYTTPDITPSHYATKVGGLPWLPGTAAPLGSLDVHCGACGSKLPLVLQAYAPLTASQAGGLEQPDRVLLLYGCCAPSCGRLPGSWRAFTCSLAAPQAHGTQQQPEAAAKTQGPAMAASGPSQGSGQQGQGHQPPVASCGSSEQGMLAASSGGRSTAGKPGNGYGPPSSGVAGFDDGGGAGTPGVLGFDADTAGLGCFDDCMAEDAGPAAGGAGSSAFDFGDLEAALEDSGTAAAAAAAAAKRAGKAHAAAAVAAEAADHSGSGAAAVPTCVADVAGGPLLPEFYLYAQEEPAGPTRGPDMEHVHRLLQEYEQQQQQQQGHVAAAAGPSKKQLRQQTAAAKPAGAAGGGEGRGMDEDDEGGSAGGDSESPAAWGGEEYEEDHVAGVEDAYLKFASRLQREPTQCVRYSRGGTLLWPLATQPDPGTCGCCGAPLIFELQVMAPLISMLLEAAATVGVAEDGGAAQADRAHQGSGAAGMDTGSSSNGVFAAEEGPRVEALVARPATRQALNGAANWDLCTVAVFTCARGGVLWWGSGASAPTHGHGLQACWAEALVHIANEDDCHCG